MSRERGRTLRVPLEALGAGRRSLSKETSTYVGRVHRLGIGDAFVAFDPERAMEADAEIVAAGAGGREIEVQLGEPRPARVRAPREVTLVQALGKGDKMDAIVRDATELGATRIAPVIAERSVVRPADVAAKAERWRRIAIEAARQCGRGDAPKVEAPAPILEVVAGLAGDVYTSAPRGVCLAPGGRVHLGEVLRALPPAAGFTVIVGPEGGLSPAEIAACEAAGFPSARLGPLVLRTETVCAAVLGALLVLAEANDAAPVVDSLGE